MLAIFNMGMSSVKIKCKTIPCNDGWLLHSATCTTTNNYLPGVSYTPFTGRPLLFRDLWSKVA